MTPPLHELREPLDDPSRYANQLQAIQGNILRPHGRARASHLLLAFHPEAAAPAIRRALGSLAVTSAWQQETGPGRPFTGIGISGRGYAQLGAPFPGRQLPALAAARLPLPPAERWEAGWRQCSAVVILADDDAGRLAAAVSEARSALEPVAAIHEEPGATIVPDPAIGPIEHFGFADAVSRPAFFRADLAAHPRAAAGPYLVLHPDPHGSDPAVDAGSFLAFLKLEQNVRRFRLEAARLAEAAQIARPLAEAYLIGRFRDGTPLALAGAPGRPTDDFDYAADAAGRYCPWAAHIRKMNPRRGPDAAAAAENASRIARRGIPYGEYVPPQTEPERVPAGGRGLLFQCVQRDLAMQFEKLYARWAREPDFPVRAAGADPLLSDADPPAGQWWPAGWGSAAPRRRCAISRLVAVRGGEYFFLPSLRFLRQGATA